MPYLADHGFQDMVVLPGSFYIEMALQVHREIFKTTPTILRNLKFQNPVILSDEDSVIKVKATENDGRPIKYMFFEGAGANTGAHLAGLEIEPAGSASSGNLANEFCIEEFKNRAASVTGAEAFYQKLCENGNQYGPRFSESLHRLALRRSGAGKTVRLD